MFTPLFQAESVRDAAWGCDWVGTPVPFQRCLAFTIAIANKEFTLTAGKFVPVSNSTMMNVRTLTDLCFWQSTKHLEDSYKIINNIPSSVSIRSMRLFISLLRVTSVVPFKETF
jgi:hypothetical protein